MKVHIISFKEAKSLKEDRMENDLKDIERIIRNWLDDGNEYDDEEGLRNHLEAMGYDKQLQRDYQDYIDEILMDLIES